MAPVKRLGSMDCCIVMRVRNTGLAVIGGFLTSSIFDPLNSQLDTGFASISIQLDLKKIGAATWLVLYDHDSSIGSIDLLLTSGVQPRFGSLAPCLRWPDAKWRRRN